MSEISIKNEVGCRDDTMPKTVDTRKHCKVGLRACNNLPQPPPYIFVFRGCGRLLHALNPTLQCFLVSTVFGMVSSLHLTSFLMIFTLVITCTVDLPVKDTLNKGHNKQCSNLYSGNTFLYSCTPKDRTTSL